MMEDPELDLESREKAVRHLAGLEADMKEVGRDLVSLSDRHGSMEKVPCHVLNMSIYGNY